MTQVQKYNNSVAFTENGQGPAVVLLHGLFGSGDNLAQLANDLAADHRVVSIDLPGHGHSAPLKDYAHASMASAIAELLDELNLKQISLIGHSLGGKVGMQIASEATTNSALSLDKLVIVDIAPRDYPPHHDNVFAGLNQVPLGQNIDRRQADKILSEKISEAGIRAFLLKSFRRDDNGAWSWQFDLSALEKQTMKLAMAPSLPHQVQCPTLFIKGALSDYILPDDEAAIKQGFALPEFKIINNTGHWPHAEKPAAFNSIVRRFITRSSATSPSTSGSPTT